MNITRALDWERKFNAAKKKHIDDAFGPQQLYLEMLGTHAEYQGKGAGTQLVRSGMERAKAEGLVGNVTLIAQPTAETFYQGLEFESVEEIGLETLDMGGKRFLFVVMAQGVGEA